MIDDPPAIHDEPLIAFDDTDDSDAIAHPYEAAEHVLTTTIDDD